MDLQGAGLDAMNGQVATYHILAYVTCICPAKMRTTITEYHRHISQKDRNLGQHKIFKNWIFVNNNMTMPHVRQSSPVCFTEIDHECHAGAAWAFCWTTWTENQAAGPTGQVPSTLARLFTGLNSHFAPSLC